MIWCRNSPSSVTWWSLIAITWTPCPACIWILLLSLFSPVLRSKGVNPSLYPRRVYRDLPVHSFVCVPMASPLCRLHFLTDCDETSHTYSQTSSLVRVRKWASQVTCKPPPPLIGGFCSPENSDTSNFDEI